MQPEIELKLELSPDMAGAVAHWPPIAALDSQTALLTATYFDTPDRKLARQGVSLRIRRSGRRRIQTMKANGQGAAGLFARDEWEIPVRGRTPVLDDRMPVAAFLGDAVAELAPAFEVEVERRSWIVPQGDAMIEMVLDQGVVRSGDREQAICEIELELKGGTPSALFALARRIDADIAVRPGLFSKAARGYRLSDALPPAYKAEPIAITPDLDIGTAFRRVVAACLHHYRLNEGLLLDAYAAPALHQARVAIRRLRTAIGLFRPVLRAEDVSRFQGELRWLARIMGDARDLDVLDARIVDQAQRETLQAAQAVARDRVSQWLRSARVRALLIDLTEWLAQGAGLSPAAGKPVAPFATKRLGRLRRRIAKRGRHMARLDDEVRHDVRKDAKKLRYSTEYFAIMFERPKARRRYKRFVSRLERMQDVMGALNDLVTAPATFARHGLTVQPDLSDKPELLSAAADAHEAFADARRFWI